MGRRPRLTPTLQQAIVTAIAGGVPFESACLMAGVNPIEACEWRQRGEGTHPTRPCKPIYADFAEAIARARAQDEARRILRINQAGQGGAVVYEKVTTYQDGRQVREVRHAEPNWQADAFHLERSYRNRWGRTMALTDPSGEQPWDATGGLAALLDFARTRLAASNGHLPLPAPQEES